MSEQERKGTGFINVMKSTLFAAAGIQTKENRERDFKNGKLSHFVIAGIIFVALFIVSMYAFVKLVVSLATG